MEILFTQAARRHRIGRSSARHVMATTIPTEVTTAPGNPGWRYVGRDQGNRELEIIAVEVTPDNVTYLLVVHVMPITLRR